MTDLKFYQELAGFFDNMRPGAGGDWISSRPPSEALIREINNRLKKAQGKGWESPKTNLGLKTVKLLLENRETKERIEARGWWSRVSDPEADFVVLDLKELRDGE